MLLAASAQAAGADDSQPLVRIALLEIYPEQLQAFKDAVTKEMAESVKVEPGVLALYSVAVKDKPNTLYFFEIYTDQAAFEAHMQAPHFKEYRDTTRTMIKSRQLMETDVVQLNSK